MTPITSLVPKEGIHDHPLLPSHLAPNAAAHLPRKPRPGPLQELDLLDTRHLVISSFVPTKRDGLPYANSPEPSDPGVAVYFDRYIPSPRSRRFDEWKPFVIACDHYTKFRWNLRAIAMTVEALRTIARHGASSMLEQAFTGFAALPPASNGAKPWWEVLGVDQTSLFAVVRDAWLELVKIHHPDAGGSTARMAEINAAYEAAKAAR